ncbi:hypothetical protein KIL84_004279 [Mauremys mutica]|uniref:Ig-like domain-containing protein n=1 Tax=Mauremys mutica TaxID=74926 RepID=A0A9D4AZW2_9SAUR|nr:hypothetical protein KIL84_004279 [Mauremys mutica]
MLGARRPHSSAALLSAVLLLHVQAAAAVSFQVLVPAGPLSAPLGGTVLLPCHLSPALSAQAMQVKWSRPQLGQDVHVYLPDGSEVQGERYRGRTELLRDGIQSGSLALRIWNLTLRDEGRYLCDFQSETYFSDAALELRLTSSGSDPLLDVGLYEDKGVSVTCLSAGWYPEPSVLWRNSHKKILSPESEQKLQSDDGLFNVSSTMVMTESSDPALTCTLSPGSPGPEKVSAIFISDTFFPRVSSWRVPFFVILTICVCFLALAALCLWRIHKEKVSTHLLLPPLHPQVPPAHTRSSPPLSASHLLLSTPSLKFPSVHPPTTHSSPSLSASCLILSTPSPKCPPSRPPTARSSPPSECLPPALAPLHLLPRVSRCPPTPLAPLHLQVPPAHTCSCSLPPLSASRPLQSTPSPEHPSCPPTTRSSSPPSASRPLSHLSAPSLECPPATHPLLAPLFPFPECFPPSACPPATHSPSPPSASWPRSLLSAPSPSASPHRPHSARSSPSPNASCPLHPSPKCFPHPPTMCSLLSIPEYLPPTLAPLCLLLNIPPSTHHRSLLLTFKCLPPTPLHPLPRVSTCPLLAPLQPAQARTPRPSASRPLLSAPSPEYPSVHPPTTHSSPPLGASRPRLSSSTPECPAAHPPRLLLSTCKCLLPTLAPVRPLP